MNNIGKIGLVVLLAAFLVMASVSCGGGGIPQEDYDAALKQLSDAQDELASMADELADALSGQTPVPTTDAGYQDLKNQYDASVADLESLRAQYDTANDELDELMSSFELLEAENESNLYSIELLQDERTQLQQQLLKLTPPFPPIDPAAIEQALFVLVNQDRVYNGLDPLATGKNLVNWSRVNSEAMSVAKQNITYDDNWVPYQRHFIATGYHTLEDLTAAAMVIWKSSTTQYQDNILADDALYGAVSVVKLGDIYYITFMASNYP